MSLANFHRYSELETDISMFSLNPIAHVLKESNLLRRVDVYDLFLKRQENYLFLKQIINGDEKRLYITIFSTRNLGV